MNNYELTDYISNERNTKRLSQVAVVYELLRTRYLDLPADFDDKLHALLNEEERAELKSMLDEGACKYYNGKDLYHYSLLHHIDI